MKKEVKYPKLETKSRSVLFVFRNMGLGGAQKIQAFVANACFEAGYLVSVINMSDEPVTVDVNPSLPISTLDYDYVIKTVSPLLRLVRKLRYLLRFRNLINHNRPDLICVFLTDVVRLTVLALTGLGIPILASERGDPTRNTPLQKRKYEKALNKCTEVVFQLEQVRNAYKLKPSTKTVVIPNPCIPRLGSSFHSASDSAMKCRFVISAGRLCKQKRFDILVRAFRIVADKYPDYCLWIYGEGDQREHIENLTKHLGLVENVFLPGNVHDVFSDAEGAQVFALSSDYEGIPNVLIEAMGHGIPCISTDCTPGGAAFLLDNGRRGMLVPVQDWEALGAGMIKLIESEELRKQYSIKGQEIFELFRPEIIKGLWLSAVAICLNPSSNQEVAL